MYDKYESTSDDVDFEEQTPIGQAKEAAGPVIQKIMNNKKKIIAVIVALVVLFFIYDFFIGSYRSVSVNITDTEGKSINATVKLFDASGEEIEKFTGSKDLSLKIGSYSIEVRASGYTAKKETYSVDDARTITIELEDDMDVKIEGTFPDQVVNGETIEVPVTLTNNGTEAEEVSLEFDNFGNDIDPSYSPELIVIGPNQTLPIIVTLEINKRAGAGEIKGKVRVRLTKESVSASFEIIEFSESKVDIDKSKITETLNASEVEKTVFKIKNDNAVELRNVEIVIDITNANYVEKEKALTWFSVSPPGYFTIPAKEGSTKGETSAEIVIAPKAIDLDIPAEAKEATISGNVIVRSTYMEKTIRFDYTINKSEIEISIEKMDDEYTAQYDDVRLKYTANDEIEFKNDGDVSLKRIEVREFQCKDNINEKYQKTEDIGVLTDYWEEIRPTEKKTTKLAIALSSVHAADKTFFCKMIVSHDNPFFVPGEGLDDVIFTEKEFIVITAR